MEKICLNNCSKFFKTSIQPLRQHLAGVFNFRKMNNLNKQVADLEFKSVHAQHQKNISPHGLDFPISSQPSKNNRAESLGKKIVWGKLRQRLAVMSTILIIINQLFFLWQNLGIGSHIKPLLEQNKLSRVSKPPT